MSMTMRNAALTLGFLALMALAFAIDAPVIRAVRAGPEELRALARSITWIGKSDWMAIVLLIWALVAASVMQRATSPVLRARARLALRLAVLFFLAILISGVAVQILKHLIGRPRPEYFDNLGPFALRPLRLGENLNSFPSGHSTTMGAVCLIAAWLWPRRWPLWAGLAALIALSRVLTASHYPSDIVAGLASGALVSALILRRLVRLGALPPRQSPRWAVLARCLGMCAAPRAPDQGLLRLAVRLLALTLGAVVLFVGWPGLDLWVSGLFFDPDKGFWLNRPDGLQALRDLYSALIYGVLALGMALWALALRWPGAPLPPQVGAFVTLGMLIGPGLLANGLFKAHWGRARPADVAEFGGSLPFTLPFETGGGCLANCSFVSGEGSGIAMAACLILGLFWPALRGRRWALTLGLLFAVIGIGLRVIKGRHFLSDSVFAVLLSALVAMALYRLLDMRRHRAGLEPAAFTAMARLGIRYVTGPLWRDIWTMFTSIRAIFVECSDVLRHLLRKPEGTR